MAVLSASSWKAFVIYVTVCLSSVATVEYSQQMSFDGGKFVLSWFYNATDDSLNFKVVVEAIGWVGLGFSDQKMDMRNLDIAVGGVAGGSGYLNDYHANDQITPTKDGQQSYNLLNSSESGGKTTIEISRKRNTSDSNDTQFTAGKEVYVAWAYHTSKDALSFHSAKGYSSAKVLFVPVAPTATTSGGSTEMGPQTTRAPTSQPMGSQAPTSHGSRVFVSSQVIFLLLSLVFSM